jgi:Transposase DNA-binding/Transposase Tn5 dimerisation domain
MLAQPIETSQEWANRQFGACQLGDRRRIQRAVKIAAALHAAPGASIPQQMKSWKATKAAYRFFSDEAYQYGDLLQPHWEQTRQAAGTHAVVLMVQDLTTLDYTPYQQHIQGLGLIGDNRGQGFQLTTVLALLPQPRQVLGIAYQQPFFRQPHPANETRTQRAKRAKESDVWMQAVAAIGPAPEGVRWVHVGDRGADIYGFFDTCRQQMCDFLVRICQNRRMIGPAGEVTYLKTFATQLPAVDEQILSLSARPGQPPREALLRLAYSPLLLSAGWMNANRPPLPVWVVRVWEIDPPAGVAEPIEWFLLTSVPIETLAQAWERVGWYRCRWLVEDFHQCLKTGCQIEKHRLEEANSLLRLLAMLAPMAAELLSLREQSRLEPDVPAVSRLPADLMRVVAHLSERSPEGMTMQEFWRSVAQQGGYLGRKRDGPPGWKSLWRGWITIQTLLHGYRLAANPGFQ